MLTPLTNWSPPSPETAGASLRFDTTDPAAPLVYMASGELTLLVEVPMTVAHGATVETPIQTEPEAIAANTEFILRDGNSALFLRAMSGEVRNDADEVAAGWVVDVVHLTGTSGTPTP